MKFHPIIPSLILSVSGSFIANAAVLLEDNFDSYAPGALPLNSAWGSPIPGGTLFWSTANNSGPQAIVDGAALGRSGNVFSYREEATGQSTTFSYTKLSTPYTAAETWTLSVDFRIDSLHESGYFNIVDLYSSPTDIKNSTSRNASRMTSVTLNRTGTGHYIAIASSHLSDTQFTGALAEDQWYTLTITGNNSTRSLSYNITDGGSYSSNITGKTYKNSLNGFDTIGIGDAAAELWSAGAANQVYLDQLRLTAIPEGSALVLLAGGGIIAAAARRWSRSNLQA